MSAEKKQTRDRFHRAVFARDRHRCKTCHIASDDMDAHHITDRNEMPGGGYVPENGISLCPQCHEKAEVFHRTGAPSPGFSADELYALIGSSRELAVQASARRTR